MLPSVPLFSIMYHVFRPKALTVPQSDQYRASENDNALTREVCDELLTRAKDVAGGITDRVQAVLGELPMTHKTDVQDRPLRVLCVDDNHDAADTLAAVLDLMGCDARACYDGETALDVVEDFHPDVCLLDLMMPGMDGIQLASRLRDGARSRPLILAAATALGSIVERTLTAVAGFHFHLVKPIGTEAIRNMIDRVRALLHRA